MIGQIRITLTMLLSLVSAMLLPNTVVADQYKVLVVFSYEQDFYWTKEIRQGIESVLADKAKITYFHMDTKDNLAGGKQKASQAYELYRQLQPDGVITADDNAQHMFVVPYLRDKVDTPVMFSGVNAEPQKYGYPASNVSGILERGHIRESIAFLKQFSPAINNIGFIAKDSPSGRAVFEQIERESGSYAVDVCDRKLVKYKEDLISVGNDFKQRCDAVYVDGLGGLTDDQDNKITHRHILDLLDRHYQGPVLGANRYHVEQGALSAVIKTGQEQGQRAAEMLLKAMEGTPIMKLPISRNFKGRRILNVSTMKMLGIQPRAITLRGAELVRTR
ncbi:MAG: hypothetical protein OQK12_14630 [Motiliproteus sp.]|nr:hypothetical protein [Motiliproteus sp.]MCW9052040.1 hypothetical protein [Motiliproteus sp.]